MDLAASSSRLAAAIAARMSAAASDVMADVGMTFALYEAEVSGLRREVVRLRSQLDLLQPRVKLEPTDEQLLLPLCPADGADGWWDDAGQTRQIKLEEPETPMIVSYTGGLTEDQRADGPGPDVASRSADETHTVAPHLRTLDDCVDLKICILTDWTIQEASDQVEDRYSVHEMRFRSGQQEADFLKLLRSFFPLLAPRTPFDFLVTDPTNRLQPLQVTSFTPEQICSAAGNSALYIRLKCPVEQEAGSCQQPMPTSDDDFNDEVAPPMELQAAANRNEAPPERPVENQSGHNEDVVLKVRLIEDSRIVVLSKTVLKKYKSKKLRCRRGMPEAELLQLLMSTFPQLAAGTPFEFLITNNTKKLLPLKLESLTPEQISSAAGNSALYIRLKPVGGDIKSRLKDLLAAAPRKRKESETTPQLSRENINLRIHVLEDPDVHVVTAEVLRKFRLNHLACRRGMPESDFLQLLRSSFPQLAPFAAFKSDRSGKLLPLHLPAFTPELICAAAGTSALYLRLQHPEEPREGAEEPQQRDRDGGEPPQDGEERPHVQDAECPHVQDAECPHVQDAECPHVQDAECPHIQDAECPHIQDAECPHIQGGEDGECPHIQDAECPHIQDGECPHPATVSDRHEDPAGPQLHLKICYLEESQMESLRSQQAASPASDPQLLLQTFPMRVLKCPRGLQQLDFLDLLSSSVPQLDPGRPFSVFALQGQKMLNLYDPEEIRTIDSLEASVICVQQPKDPPQKEAAESKDPRPKSPQASSQSPRRTTSDPEGLVELKICIVDDPKMDVASPLVLQKYPTLTFRCPGCLQEAEFLRSLRTSFPQLAGGGALDFLAGAGGGVKPIDLRSLTPGDISRTLSSAGGSLLYVRLKERRGVRPGGKRSRPDVPPASKNGIKRRKTSRSRSSAASSEDAETEDSEDDGHQRTVKSTEVSGQETDAANQSDRSSRPPAQETDRRPDPTPNDEDDEPTDDSDDERYTQHPLVCKLSLGLLQPESPGQRSDIKTEPAEPAEQKPAAANSQGDDGETEDSEDYHDPGSVESSRLSAFHPRRPESETKPDTSKTHVKKEKKKKRRKKKEIKVEVGSTNRRMEAVEIVDSEDGDDKKASVWSLVPWRFGTDRQTSPGAVKTEEVEVIDIEDDDGDEASPPQQKTRTAAEEIVDGDHGDADEASPSSSTPQPQASGSGAEAGRKASEDPTPGASAPPGGAQKPLHRCEACQTYHRSRGVLIRHVWRSHANNQGVVCGVCSRRLDSTDALKKHLQTHKKTYSCSVCGKTFFTKSGCQRHTMRHQGGDPEQK